MRLLDHVYSIRFGLNSSCSTIKTYFSLSDDQFRAKEKRFEVEQDGYNRCFCPCPMGKNIYGTRTNTFIVSQMCN